MTSPAPHPKPFDVRTLPYGAFPAFDPLPGAGTRQIAITWVRHNPTGRVGVRIVLLCSSGVRFVWFLENTPTDLDAFCADVGRNITDPDLPFTWNDAARVFNALRTSLPPQIAAPPPVEGGS